SRLYSPSHPAVLKLIHHACTAAIQAGIPVSVCGEIAGNPVLAGALLGMGVRELSMNPSSIPAVKKLLCSYELATFRSLFQSLISVSDREEVDQLLENWSQANL
ncbi:MAG: putative PEP-binding protein, partial [Balneolaceae bacterium]